MLSVVGSESIFYCYTECRDAITILNIALKNPTMMSPSGLHLRSRLKTLLANVRQGGNDYHKHHSLIQHRMNCSHNKFY